MLKQSQLKLLKELQENKMKHLISTKKTRKYYLVLFLMQFIIFSTKLQAQAVKTSSVPEFAPKSPEASAFLKYGEYPVDLSTGVPSISLPIYSIKVDDLEVPISLNYHASGIKVNQEATWVGLGWNLNAGAQIILSPRGSIDENDAGIDTPQRDASYVKQFFASQPYNFNSPQLAEYEKSKEKDVYSFSSPTASGSFYIYNGVPIIFPPDAFKVELSGTVTLPYFTITDKAGNKYLFKNTVEKSERVFTHHDDYVSAWYVDEINTAKNNKIKFTYQDDGDVIEYSESESIAITEEGKNCGCSTDVTKVQNVGLIRKSTENTITSTKKIKEITFNDDQSKVEFVMNKGRLDLINSNGYLESIKVSQNTPNGFYTIKKVSFEYSYFNEDQTGSDAYKHKRLKLNRIFEPASSNEHSFVYSDIALPIKDSKSQDFYGYYNGASNSSLIPKHILRSPEVRTVGTANRTVSSSLMQAGILKQINYPTKGSSRFNYEANTFYGVDELNKYSIQSSGASLTGIGPANVPAPPQREDPDGESDFEGQNCLSDGNCLKYKTVHRQLLNPQSGHLTYTIINDGDDSDQVIKYKYCRVWVYSNGEVFDSGKKNKNFGDTIPISLVAGDCIIVLESYGENMRIGATINYTEVDLTPKNIAAAGVRIQSIENYNSDNVLLAKKTYEYIDKDNAAKSSGQFINGLEVDFISNPFANFTQGLCQMESASTVIYKVDYNKGYSINSRSKQGIESNTIIYKYVKETTVDTKTAEKMYTQYEFSTDGDWVRPDVGIVINYGWKRGKVLEKKEFKTVGSSNYIIRNEKNTYFEDNSKTANVIGYKLDRRSFIDVYDSSQQQPAILTMLQDCQVPQSLSTSYVLADYNIPIPWFYQKTSEVTDYFYNSSNSLTGTVVTTTNFNYNNPLHLQLSSQTSTNSIGETMETKYFYAQDTQMTGKPFINELKLANMIGIPLETQIFKGGSKISDQLTIYDKSTATSNLLLPKTVYANKGLAALDLTLDKKLTYNLYDDKGNVLQYTPENGIPVSIIWGYYKTQPIAKADNLLYTTITAATITNLQTLSNQDFDNCMTSNCKEQLLRNGLNAFRTAFQASFISTYTFNPLVGVTSMTDSKGSASYYEYDNYNRLRFIRDNDQYVIQKNCYNYKGEMVNCSDNSSTITYNYKSASRSGSFTKNNCAAGGTGSSVVYNQDYGAATSTVSQADADAKGLTLFNTNGQANANASGTCTFKSIARSGFFTKNNCTGDESGSSVSYSQPAGAATSIVSQADADAKGLALFNTNGQANANANGTCLGGFTYETYFNASTRKLYIYVFAASTNHNGATFNFTVNYIRTSGSAASTDVSVVLPAGQAEAETVLSLIASSVVSINMLSLVQN